MENPEQNQIEGVKKSRSPTFYLRLLASLNCLIFIFSLLGFEFSFLLGGFSDSPEAHASYSGISWTNIIFPLSLLIVLLCNIGLLFLSNLARKVWVVFLILILLSSALTVDFSAESVIILFFSLFLIFQLWFFSFSPYVARIFPPLSFIKHGFLKLLLLIIFLLNIGTAFLVYGMEHPSPQPSACLSPVYDFLTMKLGSKIQANCFQNLITNNFSPEICEHIPSENISNAYEIKTDRQRSNLLSGLYRVRGRCWKMAVEYGQKNNNLEVCVKAANEANQYEGGEAGEKCVINAAIKNSDVSLCDRMPTKKKSLFVLVSKIA